MILAEKKPILYEGNRKDKKGTAVTGRAGRSKGELVEGELVEGELAMRRNLYNP